MEFELLLSFIGASVVLTLMPGPDNIYVLSESIIKGYKNGIAISVGLVSGIIIHTLAAATGLSILIQKSEILFVTIKYLGVAYLFYLAIMAVKEKQTNIDISEKKIKSEFRLWQLIKTGFFMNVLNPKVSLFFIAFLPQFVSKTGYSFVFQMIILGVIFMLQALLIFTIISLLSGRLSVYLNNSRFWNFTKWIKVGILFILGIVLAFSEK